MAVNNGMLICSFYIKKRFSREREQTYALNNEYQFVDDVGEPYSFEDAFSLLNSFYLGNTSLTDDEKQQRVFAIKSDSYLLYETETYRAASFVVMSGSYGLEGTITNRHTQKVVHQRKTDEADIKEFACVVYIPKDAGDTTVEKGILVFQCYGAYGVKTITTNYMKQHFSRLGLTFETRSISIRSFMEKLIEHGRLHKITLIKNHLSPNDADNMLIATGREEKSYIRPNLRPEWLEKILNVFDWADETGICEIPDGEDYDDISIQFQTGNRWRTVRLKRLEKLSIIEDVPDGVVTGSDMSRLINYMIQTADEYKEKMVFTIGRGA